MEILSNGSKGMGEEPDPPEKLLEMLGKYTLRKETNDRGLSASYSGCKKEFYVWGNFEELSHVFDIRGTLEEMRPFMRAVKENLKRR